jgi:hypothetical protein
MPDDDKQPKEEPIQKSQEIEIVLPEKDWQLALGNDKSMSSGEDED